MRTNLTFTILLFAGSYLSSYAQRPPVRVIADHSPIAINDSSVTRHGPEKGSLIIIGGGGSTPEIWKKFTDLAGGVEKARIVFVSLTDPRGDTGTRHSYAETIKKETGIKDVTVIYTNDFAEANTEKFVAPLRRATGVFFDGGRQWHFADAYLNTLTHQAFIDLLNRGGVIAGSSAGATILGSFLWRGDTKGPHVLVGDHTQGLGFLKNSVIDQHLLARNREFDLVDFIRQTPQLIGIGLDQATAIVVQRDTLEVVGKTYVAIYDYNTIIGQGAKHVVRNARGVEDEDYTASSGPFFFLGAGQKYDLKNRKVIPAERRRPGGVPTGVTTGADSEEEY